MPFDVLPAAAASCSLPSMTIRILIVDDHPIMRTGLKAALGVEPDLVVVAEAADGAEAVAMHTAHAPDVTLMDLRMPRLDGIAAIQAILTATPGARVLAMTTYDGDADIYRALRAGACGYLIKDMLDEEIVRAVRAAGSGRRVIPPAVAARLVEFTPRVDLTPREVEVLRLVALGGTRKQVAEQLVVSEGTVRSHLEHIYSKIGVSNRAGATLFAMEHGLLS